MLLAIQLTRPTRRDRTRGRNATAQQQGRRRQTTDIASRHQFRSAGYIAKCIVRTSIRLRKAPARDGARAVLDAVAADEDAAPDSDGGSAKPVDDAPTPGGSMSAEVEAAAVMGASGAL